MLACQRAATAILDWCAFLWGAVRVALVALVLEWQGELFMKAIAAAGYQALANAFLVGWTAAIGLGVVLWFARQAREEARR